MRRKTRHRFAFQYEHVKGRAVVHLGSKRHGADDISSGTRRNLIIWNHNRNWRASAEYETRMQRYRRESAAPDARCLSYTHDRDWEALTGEPRPEAKFARTAWCPPPRAEAAAQRQYGVAAAKFGIKLRSGEVKIPVVACYLEPSWQALLLLLDLAKITSSTFPF